MALSCSLSPSPRASPFKALPGHSRKLPVPVSFPGSKNEELMTPLHIASLNLRMKIVSVLLKENQAGLLCTRQCHVNAISFMSQAWLEQYRVGVDGADSIECSLVVHVVALGTMRCGSIVR